MIQRISCTYRDYKDTQMLPSITTWLCAEDPGICYHNLSDQTQNIHAQCLFTASFMLRIVYTILTHWPLGNLNDILGI